ncbi:hemolysin family protein [Halococcoides cellulosivorans]|uniref:Cobalt transporter n=1 Tax=Halococcoides cellulosivorans TaxID=1679096 RepID=A0A2R4X0X0_9EURY|nr:hemolysin family protein [Halococcoides cellulosivorans]AWB27425.1 cobalt transporter [Halococcoides cellulosivorans]
MVEIAIASGKLLIALFLVALNGFFVASEFALVRVRSTSVEQLVAEDRPGSGALQGIMENLDNYLAVTQLGITLASLGLGWAGEPAIANLLEPVLGSVLPTSLLHLVSFGIAFGTITFLHVVFGELAPKTIAIAEAERLSLFVAPPLTFCYYLFYPGIVVFNGTANLFTRMIGIPPASETDESLEERELRRVLARSGEAGHVDAEEVEMIERVFDLNDVDVREIMVPQPDVVSLAPEDTPDAFRTAVREFGHTRYPVLDGDDVVGFVDAKDLLAVEDADTLVGDLARDVLVISETTTISDLLLRFREDHQQMAVIVDEWGAFEGLVTVEDAVEAIVGDIRDQFDHDDREPTIRQDDDGTVVDGGVPLSAVEELFDVSFDAASITTIGGLVLDRLDDVPVVGDRVTLSDLDVEVTVVDGVRVSTVRIHAVPAEDDESSADVDADVDESPDEE